MCVSTTLPSHFLATPAALIPRRTFFIALDRDRRGLQNVAMQILKNVLNAQDVSSIRDALKDAPFEDGKLTAKGPAARAKNNLQLKHEGAQPWPFDDLIINALARHQFFNIWALPQRIAPPLISRYDPGMAYGAHVDNAMMGRGRPMRTDISITLFLSDPKDYDGGELAIEIPGGSQSIKLPAGDGVAYPTFALHQVMPVKRGQRLVAVLWAQSLVRDPAMRQVLFDMNVALATLTEQRPDAPETKLIHKAYNNLFRLEIET